MVGKTSPSLAALIPTLLAFVLFLVVRDYIQIPEDVHWGNAGEEQIVGFAAIYGGMGALLTYAPFIVPLVLLWPVRSQLKHWYALMLVSLMWLPPALAIACNARPVDMLLRELLLLEPFALLACGLYLFLLHRVDLMGERPTRNS